jgi:hypothetical protein
LTLSTDPIVLLDPSSRSFGHEVLNLKIAESLSRRFPNHEIRIIGERSFCKNLKHQIELFFSSPSNFKYRYLRASSNTFSIRQLIAEIIQLNRLRNSRLIVFLTISPVSILAVYIFRILSGRSMARPQIAGIFHGYLANLAPNKSRPDPYCSKNLKFLYSLGRHLFQTDNMLTILERKKTMDRVFVLAETIIEELRNSSVFRSEKISWIPHPVYRFPVCSLEKVKQFNLLVIGKPSPKVVQEIIETQNSSSCRIGLILDKSLKDQVSENEMKIYYRDLSSRAKIIEAANQSAFVLSLRVRPTHPLQVSGQLFEGIALSRPIIFPIHMQKFAQFHGCDLNLGIPYQSISELKSIICNHELLTQVKQSYRPLPNWYFDFNPWGELEWGSMGIDSNS